MAFITKKQMVDPKFVINLLNLNAKEKNISSKGETLSNITKVHIHIKISSKCNAFNKLQS